MMNISAEQLGYVLAECFNAVKPDTESADANRWIGRLGELVALALRRNPDEVVAAIRACAEVEIEEGGVEPDMPDIPSSADIAAAIELFGRHEPDDDRYDYMANIDCIPADTDIDFELAQARHEEVPADFDGWDIDQHECDFPDPSDPEIWGQKPPDRHADEGGGGSQGDEPVPQDERRETSIVSTGFLCTIKPLDKVPLARIRRRASWVKSVVHDAKDNGGRVDILSIFPDPTRASSLVGYKPLIAGHAKNGCGFEEALEIEARQDDLPLLKSLPDGIVIDFPGIHAWGAKDEYGILRMKRDKDGRWKAGFEWTLPGQEAHLNPIFSDKVRIAVFVWPEADKKKK